MKEISLPNIDSKHLVIFIYLKHFWDYSLKRVETRGHKALPPVAEK